MRCSTGIGDSESERSCDVSGEEASLSAGDSSVSCTPILLSACAAAGVADPWSAGAVTLAIWRSGRAHTTGGNLDAAGANSLSPKQCFYSGCGVNEALSTHGAPSLLHEISPTARCSCQQCPLRHLRSALPGVSTHGRDINKHPTSESISPRNNPTVALDILALFGSDVCWYTSVGRCFPGETHINPLPNTTACIQSINLKRRQK